MDYQQIPKVELHVHLDGSVRIDTVEELTGKTKDEITALMVADEKCHDLNDYLNKFDLPIEVLQTEENLTKVAHELGLDLKEDGVVYAEIRFAPLKHTKNGLTKEKVVDAILKGLHMIPDFEFGLILCMMRDASIEENKQVIELAKKYQNNGVVGLDLAGAEALYKTSIFRELFELAKIEKIPFTIHAGEADGKESITSAIEFGTYRIGHGVRILENKDLIHDIKEKNILLEICPTSNIQTNVVTSYENHPIRQLFDLGCPISINTDNRTVSNTTLTQEYEILAKHHNFTVEDFIIMNQYAMKCSFASSEIKNKILKILEDFTKR